MGVSTNVATPNTSFRGPLVAGLTAAVLAAAATIGVQRLFDSGFCDDSGFGCLVPALVATLTLPPVTALVVAFVLARFGIHRPYVVGFAALVTVISLLYVGFGSSAAWLSLPLALGLLTGVVTGGWAWALQPGRGAVPPVAVAGLVLAVVAGTVFVVGAERGDDRVQRLADTGAPPLLLDDADWTIVSVYADGTARISEIYDATDPAGEPPRLVLKIAPRPVATGPDTACQEYAALVIDNPPADSCTSDGDSLWTIRQGSATSYVAVTDDAVVGIDLLYPAEITAEQATGILDRLQPVSVEELADVGT